MLIVSFLSLLSGCTTTQLRTDFPTPPGELMLLPPKLNTLPDKAPLDKAEQTIIDNYTTYHEVSQQLIDLENWIKEQSKIK